MRGLKARALAPAQQLVWKRAVSRQYPLPREPHRLAVVVHSFDGYKRFWAPMIYFTTRAIDSAVPIVYLSEQTEMVPTSRCVLTGGGDFGTRLLSGLEQLVEEYEYILYLQEDMWLTDPLPGETLDGLVGTMEQHDLDVLKLGWGSFWPADRDRIVASTERLPDSEEFRWFGPNPYSLSHHCSIFRTRFLLDATRLATGFRIEHPLEQEVFVSNFLASKVKARSTDGGSVRIAVWDREPVIAYVHASENGRLTNEGRELLAGHEALDLYDESLPGESFPPAR